MQKFIEKFFFGLTAVTILAAGAASSLSQGSVPPETAPVPRHLPRAAPAPPNTPAVASDSNERSLKVDSSVNLTLCVNEGTVNINSWKRNELRVFVHDGSKFAFKVSQKSEKTGDPVWVNLVAVEGRRAGMTGECISGGEIEIDLPANAAVTLKGQETTTSIDSIRKASVRTAGGDISLRNIAEGVTATTFEGDIKVDGSKGAISLESTTGNILVFEAGPSDFGDVFRAKTNSGMISLLNVEHRQIDVNSISGTVAYNGAILSGGSYSLSTTNGSIRMAVPQNTACSVNATYGYGRFEVELPFKILTENVTPGSVKTVVGNFGSGGDAVIRLTSNSGSIVIKKQ
jgi:hypothetical protein